MKRQLKSGLSEQAYCDAAGLKVRSLRNCTRKLRAEKAATTKREHPKFVRVDPSPARCQNLASNYFDSKPEALSSQTMS